MREIKFRVWNTPTEKFRHTEKGLLTNLYQKLKSRNIKNGYRELDLIGHVCWNCGGMYLISEQILITGRL